MNTQKSLIPNPSTKNNLRNQTFLFSSSVFIPLSKLRKHLFIFTLLALSPFTYSNNIQVSNVTLTDQDVTNKEISHTI